MLRRRSLASVATVVGLLAIAACSAPSVSSFNSKENNQTGADPNGNGTFGGKKPGAPGTETAGCTPDKSKFDVPGDNCDNDGDGKVDNRIVCDEASTGATAEDFAKTMGICNNAATGFGLVSATFTRGYKRTDAPMAQQHAALGKFGNVLKPRDGAMLGILSSGYAQEFDGSPGTAFGGAGGGQDWFNATPGAGNGTAPPGFPKAATGCAQASDVNDVADLHLTLTAPTNATGFKFDFNFHSGEWPAYICSRFNDGFVAYLDAKGFNGGVADNMSFDSKKNPVSVNNGFFDRCTANAKIGCKGSPGTSTCPSGPDELAGTGFGVTGSFCGAAGGTTVAGGATGWLSSQAAVKAGETFTLDLMIWDAGDGSLDSSVLLDNFQWIGGGEVVTTSTGRPTGPN